MIRELSALILGFGLSVLVFLLTKVLAKEYKKPLPPLDSSCWPLFVAPVLFVISRYLPTFYSFTHNLTFIQHMVGGGFVSALLFLYMINTLNIRLTTLLRFSALFALVSSLGVLNEMLEFFVTQTGIYSVDGSDVWWDLVANTVGAFLFYGLYILATRNVFREK